jgi:RHS repeat-associated protein
VRFYGAPTSRIPPAVLLAGTLLFCSKSTGAQTPEPVTRFRAVKAFTVDLEVISDDQMRINGPVGFFKEQRFKEGFATRINLTERHVDIDYAEWTGEAIADEEVQLDRKSRDGSWEIQHVQSASGRGKTRVVLYIDELKKTWQLSAVEIPSVPGQESSSHHNLVSGKTESGQGPIELQAAGLRWLGKEYPLPSTGLGLHVDTPFPNQECGNYLGDWDTALTHWGHPHRGQIKVSARPEGIDEPCTTCGSVIGIENKSLGQVIAITGTPFTLHYRSDKAPAISGHLDIGGWTFNVHHMFSGQRLELGDGRQRTVGDDRASIQAMTDEIPGVVSAGGYLIASVDGSEMHAFDGTGRHLQTFDALTGALIHEFRYDARNRLAAVVDAYGHATTIDRGANGLPTAIVGPYGHRTGLEFDAAGNLVGISSPSRDKNSFAYSENGLLVAMIDPRGATHSYEYDSARKLIKGTNPAGGVTRLVHPAADADSAVDVSTASSRKTKYRTATKEDGINERRVTFPDGSVNLETTWPDGRKAVALADGTIETRTAPRNLITGHRSPFFDTVTITLPSGLESTISAERQISLSNVTNPLTVTRLVDVVDHNGAAARSTYTASTRTVEELSPSGRLRTTKLDKYGKVSRQQIDGLSASTFSYDDNGRLILSTEETATGALETRYSYDAAGNLQAMEDPLGRISSFRHDGVGRQTQITLPGGAMIGFAYDAAGNVTAVRPPGKPNHAFEYNALGLLAKYTPPGLNGRLTSTDYKYNSDRQLTDVIRSDGKTIRLAYDLASCACGKLNRLEEPKGVHQYSYKETTGRLNSISSPGGVLLTFEYDGPLLTAESWSGPIRGNVQHEHDRNLRVVSRRVNEAMPITYKTDADGLLVNAGSMVLKRDPRNGYITGTSIEKISEAISYDDLARKSGSNVTFSGTSIYEAKYSHEKLGRLVTKIETIGGVADQWEFTYDAAGRLASASNGRKSTEYSYDDNGNRLTVRTDQGAPLTAAYDEQDRLVRCGTTRYNYTDNGDLLRTTDGTTATKYDYDVFGNLVRVELADSRVIEYIVDGYNRRIGRKQQGVLQRGFLYQDGLRIAAELDERNNVRSRFVYASRMGVPDFMLRDGAAYRIICDYTGSPRLVVDAVTGRLAQRMNYDAFGNVTEDSNPGFQPFGFAGGLYDPDTKLTRFGARDYDAHTGRWTTKDPILFGGYQANLYSYVANDPLNRKDPTGRGVRVCWQGLVGIDMPKTLSHWWLETSSVKRGMGNPWGGMVVAWTDQSSKYQWKGEKITCEDYPTVDEACVEQNTRGELGIYGFIINNCQDAVKDVLEKCDRGPKASPPPVAPRAIFRGSY